MHSLRESLLQFDHSELQLLPEMHLIKYGIPLLTCMYIHVHSAMLNMSVIMLGVVVLVSLSTS